MPLQPCIDCGVPTANGPRCPAHTRRGPWSKNRNRPAQARFRKVVLAAAGNQCQWLDAETDARCPITQPLEAHHTQPGNYDPATGVALCKPHHRAALQQGGRHRQ